MESPSDSSDRHQLFFDRQSEGLLIEILIRVPSSREANQLKLVCKRWNSLISSDYFISVFNHRRHDPCLPPFPHRDSSPYSSYYSLVLHLTTETWLVRFRYAGPSKAEFDSSRLLDLSFLPISPDKKIILNCSCADLILCSYKNKKKSRAYFYVCNPLTKQWAALPSPSLDKYPFPIGETVGLLSVPSPCPHCPHGGGVDCKFTVVRILNCNPELEPWKESSGEAVSKFNFELYSSEDCRWRSCVVTTPRAVPVVGGAFMSLVEYRGKLHWLVYGHILVYDPYDSPTRFSRIIDIPTQHSYPYTFSSIGVRQDRLHVTTVCGDLGHLEARFDYFNDRYIWELEDYDTGKWSLAYKVHRGNQYSCIPEDLVYVTGHSNQQSLFDTPWFGKLRDEAHRSHVRFATPPIIVDQWWPTSLPE